MSSSVGVWLMKEENAKVLTLLLLVVLVSAEIVAISFAICPFRLPAGPD